jgi:hypothetical protein
LSEDTIEIFFRIGVKDIAQQKADEGICSVFAAFSNSKDDKLNKFGSLDGEDLILKNK